ncbi:MAG: HNH endonuclease, partial [Acidipropionibacterium jensenii]|nr:HNH endonuclease [Acidipropionibacterium jensenii]
MDDTSEFWRRIAVIEDALTALDLTGIAAMTDAQKVTAMTRLRTLEGRVSAAAAVATAAVARSCAPERTTGPPQAAILATPAGRPPA